MRPSHFCYLAGTLAVALSVSDLGKVIEVLGATGCTTIMFIVPSSLYLYYFPITEDSTDATVKQKLLEIDCEVTEPDGVDRNSINSHLVKDIPLPEASPLWRKLAWLQLTTGCLLIPTTS